MAASPFETLAHIGVAGGEPDACTVRGADHPSASISSRSVRGSMAPCTWMFPQGLRMSIVRQAASGDRGARTDGRVGFVIRTGTSAAVAGSAPMSRPAR